MIEKKITFDSFIRGIISGAIVIGILYMINLLSSVLLPFFLAWLIAYMIYPMVILTIAAIMLVPPIIEEFDKLMNLLTEYFIEGNKQAAISVTVANFIKEHIDMIEIKEFLNQEHLSNTLRNLLPQAWSILAQSVNIIAGIFTSFIILLYTFFTLLDYE